VPQKSARLPSEEPKLWREKYQLRSRMRLLSAGPWKPLGSISLRATEEGKAYDFGSRKGIKDGIEIEKGRGCGPDHRPFDLVARGMMRFINTHHEAVMAGVPGNRICRGSSRIALDKCIVLTTLIS
jgi:hypothetical protein